MNKNSKFPRRPLSGQAATWLPTWQIPNSKEIRSKFKTNKLLIRTALGNDGVKNEHEFSGFLNKS
jgi:hypothetical protein